MPAPLEIRVVNIDSAGWTPILVPFDCSSISIKNAGLSLVRIRTTADDAGTEDTVPVGAEQAFAVPFHRYRFLAGSQPVWLQAQDGTGPVIVKFLA